MSEEKQTEKTKTEKNVLQELEEQLVLKNDEIEELTQKVAVLEFEINSDKEINEVNREANVLAQKEQLYIDLKNEAKKLTDEVTELSSLKKDLISENQRLLLKIQSYNKGIKEREPSQPVCLVITDKGNPAKGIFETTYLIDCPFNHNDLETIMNQEALDSFKALMVDIYTRMHKRPLTLKYSFETA